MWLYLCGVSQFLGRLIRGPGSLRRKGVWAPQGEKGQNVFPTFSFVLVTEDVFLKGQVVITTVFKTNFFKPKANDYIK